MFEKMVLAENALHLHYKDELMYAIYGKNRLLF
jgi:hypothetical protein